MRRALEHASWRLCLLALALSLPAGAQAVAPTARSSGQMHIGLTIVAPDAPDAAPLPIPAELDYPASPSAVLCRSEGSGYRECRLPFRGPVVLSREVADTRCVEGGNWGWRDGAVWVDRGCAAVFVRETAPSPAA